MANYGIPSQSTSARLGARIDQYGNGQYANPSSGNINQFQNAVGFYGGVYGPDLAQNSINQNYLGSQLGLGNESYAHNTGFANQDYNLGMQSLGNQQQQNQLGIGGFQRQIGYQGLLNQLQNQGFDLSTQQAKNQAGVQTRGQISQGTANGALQTQGTRQQLGDIQSNLSNQLGQIGVNRQQANATSTENKAQLQQNIQNANLVGKQYGIQGGQLQLALNKQLDQLGLSHVTSADDIIRQLQSGDVNKQALGIQIIQDALANIGHFPGAAPQKGK